MAVWLFAFFSHFAKETNIRSSTITHISSPWDIKRGSPGPGARVPLIERFNDSGGPSGGAGPRDGPSAMQHHTIWSHCITLKRGDRNTSTMGPCQIEGQQHSRSQKEQSMTDSSNAPQQLWILVQQLPNTDWPVSGPSATVSCGSAQNRKTDAIRNYTETN